MKRRRWTRPCSLWWCQSTAPTAERLARIRLNMSVSILPAMPLPRGESRYDSVAHDGAVDQRQ